MGNNTQKILFIVNPNAAMGGAGREWPKIREMAKNRLGRFRSLITKGPGDATVFTRSALLDGAELIVCVGGDGTLNEIVNGFMGDNGPVRQGSRIALIPQGTGCDLRKSVRIPKEPKNVIRLIMGSMTRSIDLGRVIYMDHNGRNIQGYFHNVISFGLGGEVVDRVNRSSKALGGFISFIRATLVSLFIFEKKRILLKMDNGLDRLVSGWHVAVANGQYQGGGMRIAPEADTGDGLFHVTIIGDLSLTEVLMNLPKLYNGKVLEVDKVLSFKCKRLEAISQQRVLLDMDGEQPGLLPVTIDLIPRSLPIIAPMHH